VVLGGLVVVIVNLCCCYDSHVKLLVVVVILLLLHTVPFFEGLQIYCMVCFAARFLFFPFLLVMHLSALFQR
jgi:hypothetical protein